MSEQAPTQAASTSVNSPTKDSTKPTRSEPAKPSKPTTTKGSAKTEVPSLPPTIFKAFEKPADAAVATGATEYDIAMRSDGKVGIFYSRENGEETYYYCNIHQARYYDAIVRVLYSVLKRAMRLKGYTDDAEIDMRLTPIIPSLVHGICVMTYLKLRAVNIRNPARSSLFLAKPKVPQPFEVPVPYALAIQQLGLLEVSSLTKRTVCVPCLEAATARRLMMPLGAKWNPTNYGQAVEFCKTIGIRFSRVDLSLKIGSAWWLFRQVRDEDYFELRCPLPEDNFTESNAVVHSLFLNGPDDTLDNEFVDLSAIPAVDYGSMMRDIPNGISVNSFFAINEDNEEQVWDLSI